MTGETKYIVLEEIVFGFKGGEAQGLAQLR
jgi:hypothetical protein